MKTIRIILLIFTIAISNLVFFGLTIGLPESPKGYQLIPIFMSFILSFAILPTWLMTRLEGLIVKHENKTRDDARNEALSEFGDFLYNTRTKDPEFFKSVMAKDVPVGTVEDGITTVYNRVISKLKEFEEGKS